MALLSFFFLSFACCLVFVAAIPAFEHLNMWNADMGSLIPGASHIEMIGSNDRGDPTIKRYLNTFEDGAPGNLTLDGVNRRPEWFIIRQNKLYQAINATAIYPLNFHNITGKEGHPLQLISAESPRGNRHGTWRWQGSMLIYEEGKLSNGGLYYECKLDNEGRGPGIFTFLRPSVRFRFYPSHAPSSLNTRSRPPPSCTPLTLHGFDKILVKNQGNSEYSS